MSVLRKTSAILKSTVLLLPALSFVTGVALSIYGVFAQDKKEETLIAELSEHKIIQEYKDKDLKILEKELEEGKISTTEYVEQQSYLNSDDFVKKALEMPELAEEKSYFTDELEESEAVTTAGVVTLLIGSAFLVTEVFMFAGEGEMIANFMDSIEYDWNYEQYNFKSKKKESETLEIDI